jgi:hypothetical protein
MFREANDVTTAGSTPTRNAGGYYNAAEKPQKEAQEMSWMTTKDEHGNTVTKYAARIEHDAELHKRVHDLEHEVTDAVANLGELLARLRRLPLYALDGDDVAAAKALEALGDEDDCCGMGPVVDIDTIPRLSATIDDLEELTGARTEQYTRHVPGDEIEATVQELAAAPVADGCEVTVTEPPYGGVARPLSGRIHFDRKGKYVDIWVHRTPDVAAEREALNALIRQRGLESVYEESYQALVKAKGEAAARAIRSAVESVAKGDPEKQIELLRAAVAV